MSEKHSNFRAESGGMFLWNVGIELEEKIKTSAQQYVLNGLEVEKTIIVSKVFFLEIFDITYNF